MGSKSLKDIFFNSSTTLLVIQSAWFKTPISVPRKLLAELVTQEPLRQKVGFIFNQFFPSLFKAHSLWFGDGTGKEIKEERVSFLSLVKYNPYCF